VAIALDSTGEGHAGHDDLTTASGVTTRPTTVPDAPGATVDDRAVLRASLSARPAFPAGIVAARFPVEIVRFEQAVAEALTLAGICDDPLPLETLHERVPAMFLHAMPAITDITVRSTPGLQDAYEELVRYLARDVLGYDVVFEDNPPLRLHFPAPRTDGRGLPNHGDIFSGDPVEQINCWLPLGRLETTNTLRYASWELSQRALLRYAESIGFERKELGRSRTRFLEFLRADCELLDDYRPLQLSYGEVALCDARLLHGVAENLESGTRVSIDFRLLAVPDWHRQVDRFDQGQLAPCYPWQEPHKGRFYDNRTAFEL
jgi:hypothetical protein